MQQIYNLFIGFIYFHWNISYRLRKNKMENKNLVFFLHIIRDLKWICNFHIDLPVFINHRKFSKFRVNDITITEFQFHRHPWAVQCFVLVSLGNLSNKFNKNKNSKNITINFITLYDILINMKKILFKDYFEWSKYTYTTNMKVKIKKNDFIH